MINIIGFKRVHPTMESVEKSIFILDRYFYFDAA